MQQLRIPLFLCVIWMLWGLFGASADAQQLSQTHDLRTAACSAPLAYRIGEVDERFDVSPASLRAALKQAMAMWEAEAPQSLFTPHSEGARTDDVLVINLTYDKEQGTWEAQQRADAALAAARASHKAAEDQYEADEQGVTEAQAAYETQLDRLNEAVARYNREVDSLNRDQAERSGPGAFETLRARKDTLMQQADTLKHFRHTLEAYADTLEQAIEALNQTIALVNASAFALNQKVDAYNEQFAGGGYSKGVYTLSRREGRIQRGITIYQFDNADDLVQVITHELGHALGIEHVDAPEAIMYDRVTDANRYRDDLAEADAAALAAVCNW